MRRQDVRAIQKISTEVIRDHAYHCVDCLQDYDDTPCECPPEDLAFYKQKLHAEDADVMKVHAEHVAWVISQRLKADE